MIISGPAPAFAHERLIAELAVQRAALVTKRVLSTLEQQQQPSPPRSPISPISRHNPHHLPWQVASDLIPEALAAPRRLSIAKSDASPVTVADFAAQALLISAVHAAFPHDSFIGEEDSSSLRTDPDLTRQVWDLVSSTRLSDPASEALLARPASIEEMFEMIDLGGRGTGGRTGRFWAMDPIDGTSAFLKGQQYAISLALLEDGKEVLGVLGCPNLKLLPSDSPTGIGAISEAHVDRTGFGLMLSAVVSQGCVVRPMGKGSLREAVVIDRRPAKNSPPLPPVRLQDLHLVDSSTSTATTSDKVHQLARAAGAAYPGTEIYSSHMRYAAMVLGGREHTQVRIPTNPQAAWCIWDHAGAQLIYAESGAGRVTDARGKPIDFGTGRELSSNWGVVTADESVHPAVLELVSEILEHDMEEPGL